MQSFPLSLAKATPAGGLVPVWSRFTLQQHQAVMGQALSIATNALPLDIPVGALLLNAKGHVIAAACNNREQQQNPLGHAELVAVQQASQHLGHWRLEGCCLYVTLEPCPMCAEALKQVRLGGLVFGASDALYGASGSVYTLFPKKKTVAGVLENECKSLLHSFFKAKRTS
jgi:tRNA(adenine34) deaminase